MLKKSGDDLEIAGKTDKNLSEIKSFRSLNIFIKNQSSNKMKTTDCGHQRRGKIRKSSQLYFNSIFDGFKNTENLSSYSQKNLNFKFSELEQNLLFHFMRRYFPSKDWMSILPNRSPSETNLFLQKSFKNLQTCELILLLKNVYFQSSTFTKGIIMIFQKKSSHKIQF